MILPVSNRTADGTDAGCFSGIGKQPALFAGHIQFQYPRRIMRLSFCQSGSFAQTNVQAAFEYAKSSLHLFIYLIFKQNLRQSSSRPFLRCWFVHGSRQIVRGRCRVCFSTNRVWARCVHSIRLHPPKRSIRRCAR